MVAIRGFVFSFAVFVALLRSIYLSVYLSVCLSVCHIRVALIFALRGPYASFRTFSYKFDVGEFYTRK